MSGLDEYGPEVGAAPKIGRPTDYTPELAAAICDRLADGESLRTICLAADMPDKSTVFRWIARHEDFRDQYARAREAQADRLFDECIEIADETSGDYIAKETDSGMPAVVVDHEHISRSKLRVDTRKWAAGKLAPKKYGERVALEHTGKDGGPIKTETVTDAELDARIAASAERLAALGLAPGAAAGTGDAGTAPRGAGSPANPEQAENAVP